MIQISHKHLAFIYIFFIISLLLFTKEGLTGTKTVFNYSNTETLLALKIKLRRGTFLNYMEIRIDFITFPV